MPEKNNNNFSIDPSFKYKVAETPGGESIKACYSCGVCTAGCPVNEVYEDFNPRRLIRMILIGDKNSVFASNLIWYCKLCEKCFANCPQKVNFAHIAEAVRQIAIKENFSNKQVAVNIKKADNAISELRQKLIGKILNCEHNIDINKILKEIVNSIQDSKINDTI